MKKHVEVVAGVIKQNNRFLCTQRNLEGALPGKWEFPGGKIEEGESFEIALVRELQEELKLNVTIDQHLVTVDHEYDNFAITLHAFLCTPSSLDFNLNVHMDAEWLDMESLDDLDWAAADIPIVQKLKGLQNGD